MFIIIIRILFAYLCISYILLLIFGVLVLDNDSKFNDYIKVTLLMPFIVIGAYIEAFKEEKEENK